MTSPSLQQDGGTPLALGATQDEVRMLFVVGASRSGTTMLSRILATGAGIGWMQETHFFGTLWNPRHGPTCWSVAQAQYAAEHLIARLERGLWRKDITPDERTRAQQVVGGREWQPARLYAHIVSDHARAHGKTAAVEQTPINVLFLPELAELFPDAFFLQVVRDPRAVLYSQRNRWKKKWRDSPAMPWREMLRVLLNYHPLTMSALWKGALRQGERMATHPRFLMLTYEALLQDPRGTVHNICARAGIDFSEEMLRVPSRGSSHAVVAQERGINASLATAWQGVLPRGDTYLTERSCAATMAQFGYEPMARSHWLLYALMSLLRYPVHLVGMVLINPRGALTRLRGLSLRRGRAP